VVEILIKAKNLVFLGSKAFRYEIPHYSKYYLRFVLLHFTFILFTRNI